MNLSQRIRAVGPSATLAITKQAKRMQSEGIDVVDFGAGEPDFDTPQFIKDAAVKALAAGDTKYMPRSAAALQKAIAEKLTQENGLRVPPEQVLVTLGSKHGLYAACQVLLDPGDKALIPAPYWVSYPEMVKLAGGVPVYLRAGAASQFKITPRQILAAPRDAKVLFLNSPCNPTGMTYTPEELAGIAKAVLQTHLIVLSDEVYEALVYGGTKFVSFATLEEPLRERTITFNALSKTFSMTGWRLGWLAGPPDFIDAVARLMSHETTNPVSFAQAGALAAYTDPRAKETIEAMRQEFEVRGAHMARRLNALPGVRCVPPTGAFYCFPDVSGAYGRTLGGIKVTGSTTFTEAALKAARVALVPGEPFGDDHCVRLSFALSRPDIDKGLDRLAELLKE
jgi:aspartate aminotransferase